MARSIVEIQNQIIAQKNAEPALAELNSSSAVSLWRLWSYITAVAINLHEQWLDIFKTEVEKIAEEQSGKGTAEWLKNEVQNFQYGSQLVLTSDYRYTYLVKDDSKKIITRCSVKDNKSTRRVVVKTAKGSVPNLEKLDAVELAALNSYIDKIKFAGTYINAISLDADRLYVNAEIFYDGEYVETTVKANVIAAINTFLETIPFDGVIYKQKLVDAIQDVAGVVDVKMIQVKGRENAVPLSSATVVLIDRKYETSAGYVVAEDTALFTLEDSITMILNN